jgi:hypothetical protein
LNLKWKSPAACLLGVLLFALISSASQAAPSAFRPPAVPLVTSDPYLSIWSESDRLTDDVTRHWTHQEHPLVSLIRVDGQTFRLMGRDPADFSPLPQTGVQVTPTRSIYQFEDAHVHVTLTFMTAALPNDLDALTRPVTYLTWSVRSVDGKSHAVSVYDSASALISVNTPDQKVEWSRQEMGPLTALKVGTVDQTLLSPAGDDVRIDWGYLYAAASTRQSQAATGGDQALIDHFAASGSLPTEDDTRLPRAASDNTPVLAFVFPLGQIGSSPVDCHLIIAYDELYAVSLAGKNLRPYWRRGRATPSDLLQAAERDYSRMSVRCAQFDAQLMADAAKVGGPRYAQICALAYRQSLAATGIAADARGKPLLFTKENTSNGDIATADVLFPTSPIWLLLNPNLAKASAVPILAYAASPQWKFPNSPHDLGTYPVASATGDAGEAMPVEESGNMLLLCDAIAKADGNADFVKPYWPQLTQWAQYLVQYGLDPEDQLCTDDFMGHLAHNANLSVKAILALAAYGDLCRRRGDKQGAAKYAQLAKDDAAHWIQVADAGDHSLLAFDKPGTWSQKYNLVWDKVLGLNVFPPSVAEKEITFYKSQLKIYGVPLDSRTLIGDTDHSFFSATLADKQSDFEALISPFYDYLNVTTARLPLLDTYQTNDLHSDGLHARSVVGGVFIKMLADPALWKKWAGADPRKVSGWAPLPPPPTVTYIVPTSTAVPVFWRYTTTVNSPPADWYKTIFDDSGWKIGKGAFGSDPHPGVVMGTAWTDSPGDLWLRRTLILPPGDYSHLAFMVYHDEDVEIYVNGVPAAQARGYNNGYEPLAISPEAKALLKPGAQITLAVHVHQTWGGQGVDVGLARVVQSK